MASVKQKIRKVIDSLPEDDVEVLLKVAERLAEWQATQEIVRDKELMASIKRGLNDLRKGDIVSLGKLRKNV